jgi:hypothetical protein
MGTELHGIATAEEIISGHDELGSLDRPNVGHAEHGSGPGREQKNTHDCKDQIHREAAYHAVHRINKSYVPFDCFRHLFRSSKVRYNAAAGARLALAIPIIRTARAPTTPPSLPPVRIGGKHFPCASHDRSDCRLRYRNFRLPQNRNAAAIRALRDAASGVARIGTPEASVPARGRLIGS